MMVCRNLVLRVWMTVWLTVTIGLQYIVYLKKYYIFSMNSHKLFVILVHNMWDIFINIIIISFNGNNKNV